MTKNQLALAANPTSPPSRLALLFEGRASLDFASIPLSLLESVFSVKNNDGALPIVMFPGFASDQRWLRPLESYLRNLGFETDDWGLGKNLAGTNLPHTLDDLSDTWDIEYPQGYSDENYKGEGGVPFLCDQAIVAIKSKSEKLQKPLVLVGWSLGGYIARECARELPNHVAQVITLGAPVIGGPKYSRAAKFFTAKGMDIDWIEEQIKLRDKNPITQPLTIIYSKSDGIVDWRAALDVQSPNVEHIEVNAAHLGMGFNRKVWKLVAEALKTGNMNRATQ